ncbi:hypothetical protein, partial [Pseudokineococcus marinus]|uniref:hypothetical protein n=1 Tax=Pseudokineococcus marinus TaxID=351215 RepID=UPI0031D6B343
SQQAAPAGPPAAPSPAADAAPAPAAAAAVGVDADLVGKRVYTVVPPEGRYHDNLWDIAERELGDGRRYTEIYALNEGRVQPDGRELELARLIQPGWQLVMPEDAAGVERVLAPAPAPAPPAPAPTPAPQAGDGAASPVDAPTSGAADLDAGAEETAPEGALGLGALAAAGLVAALRRRRRGGPGADPGDAADEAEARLVVGSDPARAALLVRALASLGAAGAGSAYAVLLEDDGVEVRLAPPRDDAPAPWTSADDGARWLLAAADLAAPDLVAAGLPVMGTPDEEATGGPGADASGPFTALVGLGRDAAGRDVLVDLAAASGVVAVTGPRAHDVVAAMTAGLLVHPWGGGLDVVAWHLPEPLVALGRGARTVEDAADLLPPVRRDDPSADVLTGAESGAPASRRSLVLGATPPPAVGEALAAGGRAGAVLVAGPVPGARWTLQVDDAGTLEADVVGLSVTADRLPEASLARVAELFGALVPQGGGSSPARPGADDRPPVPPGPAADDVAWAVAPVRVAVLGALVVEAPGAVDPSRRELVEEVVAHVALHPAGVHPTVLGGDVWPRGAGAAVRAAVVERARDVLGSDAGGSYRLGEDADGRLVLGAGAVVDRDVLLHLLRRSRTAPPPEERELLRRALALVRGPLLDGRPPRRYGWLPRTGAERTTAALVVDAALRLASLEGLGGDPGGAVTGATAGLRAVPAEQSLWRALLVARADAGAGTAATEVELRAALAGAGAQPDGETAALLAELAPGDRAG